MSPACITSMGMPGGQQPAARLALAKFVEDFSNETTAQKHFCWGVLFCTGCSEVPSYILLAFAKHTGGKFHFLLYFLVFPPVPFTRLYLSFDYSILNIPMTFLHTNASLEESDVF